MELKIDSEVEAAFKEMDEAIKKWKECKAQAIQDLLSEVPYKAGEILTLRGEEYVFSHAEYAYRGVESIHYYINAHKIKRNGVMFQRSQRIYHDAGIAKTGRMYAKPVDIEKSDVVEEQNV